MTKEASPPRAPRDEPSHLVMLDDVAGYSKGVVLPNTPEIAEKVGDKARPATQTDLAVAGLALRKG